MIGCTSVVGVTVVGQIESLAVAERMCFVDGHSALVGGWGGHDEQPGGFGTGNFVLLMVVMTMIEDCNWWETDRIGLKVDSFVIGIGRMHSGSDERDYLVNTVERRFGFLDRWEMYRNSLVTGVGVYGMEGWMVGADVESSSRMGRVAVERSKGISVIVDNPVWVPVRTLRPR